MPISFVGIPNSRNVLCLRIFLKRAAKPSTGTFSGTLLNLTWLHQSVLDLLRNLLRNPVELDLALHQGFLESSPEPSPKPCWTWPGSAPKPPRPSSKPSPEPCWTWPGACTSAHRSCSGLKTPLAYAVGEKIQTNFGWMVWHPNDNSYSMEPQKSQIHSSPPEFLGWYPHSTPAQQPVQGFPKMVPKSHKLCFSFS